MNSKTYTTEQSNIAESIIPNQSRELSLQELNLSAEQYNAES